MASVSARDILSNPDKEYGPKVLFATLFPSSISRSSDESLLQARGFNSLKSFLLLGEGDPKIGRQVYLVASRLEQILSSWDLHLKLTRAFQNLTEDDLADPQRGHDLVLATDPSLFSPPPSFKYVGRRSFKKLLQSIRQKGSFSTIQFQGAPGRGKSYVLAAMAGFLHVERKVKVVYILCSNLTPNPVDSFLDALLLANAEDVTKQVQVAASSKSLEELASWCRREMRREKTVFLIDESNQLDVEKHKAASSQAQREVARCQLTIAVEPGTAVWCASVRRTPTPGLLRRSADRHLDLEFGDEPFTNEELSTWLEAVGAHSCVYQDLVFYTGLVPRLLDTFVTYGVRECELTLRAILGDFLGGLGNDATDVMERVLGGDRMPLYTIDLNREVLYATYEGVDDSKVWFLCGYLEKEVRLHLSRKRDQVVGQEMQERVRIWSAGILLDSSRENPARMGWFVEGITIDCIQIQRSFNGMQFAHVKRYKSSDVAATISACSDKELDAGILFLPEYNAKAVDAVLVKRADNALQVQGVQITVAPWERKAEKDSHGYWFSTGSQDWRRPQVPARVSFTYVLSNVMKAEVGFSEMQGVTVLEFGEVHPSLHFIDKINLMDPGEIQQCRGNLQCSRLKVIVGPYYCYQHSINIGNQLSNSLQD